MKTPTLGKKKRFLPLYTIQWSRTGAIAPPPYSVKCGGGVLEALMWFHLERQLREKESPGSYAIEGVRSDHEAPKTWVGSELPATSRLHGSLLTKRMAKKYKDLLEAFERSGGFYFVS